MRLTLRTLLAYMDNILDPEDAQAIGKRVEESEFATTLLHRVRDCMRRLRLGAPAVIDQGKGLDPNTVAEYLDNTLPADGVADFERVCLESDVHLAEVASCHQILTMVLGEPAEVDPDSRVRMYSLAEEASVATPPALPREAPESDGRKAAPPLPKEPAAARPKPELPDYLRAARAQRRRLRLVSVAILFLVAVAGLLMFAGPREALLAKFGFSPRSVSNEEPVVAASEEPTPEAVSPLPAETIQPPGAMDVQPVAPATPDAEAEAAVKPATPAASPAVAPPTPEGTPSVLAPSEGSQVPEAESPEPNAMASIPAPAASGVPLAQPAVETPAETPPDSTAQPAPMPREAIGKFTSSNDVLLRRDPENGAWWRVANQSPLVTGDTFVSLPTYRPTITLDKGPQLTLVDNTQLHMLPADAQGVIGLSVDYGRLLIGPAGQAGGQLRLEVGDRVGTIVFGDADSTIAVEVSRRGLPTADPETKPAPLTADLYAVSGSFRWTSPQSGQSFALTAPAHASLEELLKGPAEAAAASAPVAEIPQWATAATSSLLEQRASTTLQSELTVDRPAALTLTELADHRQREVRRLALRCLAAIGSFAPLIDALDDADVRMVWPDYFCVDLLRSVIVRSPAAAAGVRAAMEDRYPDEGDSLYEMLWRYGPDGLSQADAEQLVAFLNHDSLAFRRLSFWNLRRITGLGLFYDPDDTAAERRTSVTKWKERIKELEPLKAEPADPPRRPEGAVDKDAPEEGAISDGPLE